MTDLPRARGVGRMFDNEKAMLVMFDRKLSDDELRALHRRINATDDLELTATPDAGERRLTLDTDKQVFFYEQDHYYLSNFSAFRLFWRHRHFDTSEHAYHWEKFDTGSFAGMEVQRLIFNSTSAHHAFKIAEDYRASRRVDWDRIKCHVMSNLLRAKVEQHEYVRRKLLQTGDREIIENSWRDDYWGWGPNRDGQNMLGKLWMEVRAELRARGEAA